MDQSKKALIAIALLVIAAGLFAWHFKSSSPRQTEEPQELMLNTMQAKALESIFNKVGSKKWSDPSLWSSPKAASTYGAAAERLFTSTPSMDKVKILDYGTNKQNEDAPFIVLSTSTTDVCIQVDFKPNKSDQLLMDTIFESQVKVSNYKKHE